MGKHVPLGVVVQGGSLGQEEYGLNNPVRVEPVPSDNNKLFEIPGLIVIWKDVSKEGFFKGSRGIISTPVGAYSFSDTELAASLGALGLGLVLLLRR